MGLVRRGMRKFGGERDRRTFLTAAQLLDALLIVMFTVETNTDSYPCIIFYRRTSRSPLLVRVIFFFALLLLLASIRFPLNNEPASTGGDEFLEYVGEFLGYLFEGSLNSLVFPLVENGDEFFD